MVDYGYEPNMKNKGQINDNRKLEKSSRKNVIGPQNQQQKQLIR